MAAELKINDGGTWRTPKAVSVNDGGTWRAIKTIEVNDSGTWRTVFKAVSEHTLTCGYINYGVNDEEGFGLNASLSAGSIAPTTYLGGTIILLWDYYGFGAGAYGAYFRMNGFSSDPGAACFTSIYNSSSGITLNSSFATYAWAAGSGEARWYWGGSYFNFPPSGNVAVTITP